ncbi:hypothetical protein OG436_08950 [Streptomyces caniferus]|uniref:Nucleopolyhedrovirus P10 family protein n=1 Tax=Streptomyces caniferus TaxID=285557 RepID=A0A640SD96_9ACTN|nr:hypothetical protein [Streptomyces caniferus]GFE09127.1 hypothetical protein Scani_53950 [Streptomyces caniferus]
MAANQVAQSVRTQLGIGRVLPLGGPADGSWITEQAAAGALRAAAGTPAGVRIGTLRLSVADPGQAPEPVVPAPPSALPPGPLRIEADFAAVADRPLPAVADEVRTALLEAAVRELGLVVGVVDLQVSALLEAGEAQSPPPAERAKGPAATPAEVSGDRTGATQEGPAELTAVAREVPGVARLAPVLGGRSRPVRFSDGHVLIQVATAPGYRALDVSCAVRRAVAAAPAAPSTVAVLVTAVERS